MVKFRPIYTRIGWVNADLGNSCQQTDKKELSYVRSSAFMSLWSLFCLCPLPRFLHVSFFSKDTCYDRQTPVMIATDFAIVDVKLHHTIVLLLLMRKVTDPKSARVTF